MAKASNNRRVPDSRRQRALVSCDRCKKRRTRCIRPDGASSSCKACTDCNLSCTTELPRKQRIYGSTDGLSLRFRALESLVKGLFEDEDLDDTNTIFRLAAERHISMPDADDVRITNAAFSRERGAEVENSNDVEIDMVPPWPYNIDSMVQGTVNTLSEETCIVAPHGVAHYVGPASSFEFASTIRNFVARRSKIGLAQDRHEWRRKLQKDFAQLSTSIAMEARLRMHPASSVRESITAVNNGMSPSNAHIGLIQPNNNQTSYASGSTTPVKSDSLHNLLPQRAICDRLLQAFFDKVHPSYLLFHRGMFMARYEAIWQRAVRNASEHNDSGWLCSLFMALAFGAQCFEKQEFDTATATQRHCLSYVRSRFQDLSLTASLANVQALLLLQLYEHNAGERNTAWILLGQATRMAMALGMHREGTNHNFDVLERNTRRLVWHKIYSFEQFSALTLGRPTTIKALEVNVALPDETIMDGGDCPHSYFQYASALMDLCSKIRYFATAACPNHSDPTGLSAFTPSAASLLQEMDSWNKGLPYHLRPEYHFAIPRHRRGVLLLHATHDYLNSVITRPFLLCRTDVYLQRAVAGGAGHVSCPEEIETMAKQCIGSSMLAAGHLKELSFHDLIVGVTWIDFFYVYHSLMILCVNFLVPTHENDTESILNKEIRCVANDLLYMCRTSELGPTYNILSKVAMQFAHIVGLAEEESASRTEVDRTEVGVPFLPVTPAANLQSNTQSNHIMPYVEPLSDLEQFYNNDTYLDFFGVCAMTHSSPEQNSSISQIPAPFSSLFEGGMLPRFP